MSTRHLSQQRLKVQLGRGQPEVGQAESGAAVAAVDGAEQAEQGVVLRHGQELAVAEGPAAGGEVTGEHPDLADEWL